METGQAEPLKLSPTSSPKKPAGQRVTIKNPGFMLIIGVIIAFGPFIHGYSAVAPTLMQPQINEAAGIIDDRGVLSRVQAMMSFGAVLGCLIVDPLLKMGQTKVMMLADVAVLLGSTQLMSGLSIGGIWVGRILVGVGCGMSSCIVAPYLISLAPLEWAGIAGGLYHCMFTVGVAFSYFLGIHMAQLKLLGLHPWQIYMLIPLLYALIRLIIVIVFGFDTLERYYENGQQDKIKWHMRLFYSSTNIDELIRLKRLTKSNEDEEQLGHQIMGLPQKAFYVAVVLIVAFHLTGASTADILQLKAYNRIYQFNEAQVFSAMAKVNVYPIFAALVGMLLSNFFGRKRVVIYGLSVQCALLVILALIVRSSRSNNLFATMVSITLFVFNAGIGCALFTYLGELSLNLSQLIRIFWGVALIDPWMHNIVGYFGIVVSLLFSAIIAGSCAWYLWENMIETHMKAPRQTLGEYAGVERGLGVSYKQMVSEDLNMPVPEKLIEDP